MTERERQLAAEMGPGGPSRPSELAINPRNQEAKTARRVKLLAAFLSLPVNEQADFLELVEDLPYMGGSAAWTHDVNDRFRQLYRIAGWEQ